MVRRLQGVLDSPGPYASVYLSTRGQPDAWGRTFAERLVKARQVLAATGAPATVVDQVQCALQRKIPDWAASVAVVAAPGGVLLVEHDYRPPTRPMAAWAPIPTFDQVLEWGQRRISTLIVELDADLATVASYAVPGFDRSLSVRHIPDDMAMVLGNLVGRSKAELLVVSGSSDEVVPTVAALKRYVGDRCRVVGEDRFTDRGELAQAVLRHVGLVSAENTLTCLREHRLLSAMELAVEGVAETVSALRSGLAESLIVSESAWSDQIIWVGERSDQISLTPTDYTPLQVRLPDGLIRSAVLQRVPVEIRWAFGSIQPRDGLAATVRDDQKALADLHQQLNSLPIGQLSDNLRASLS